MTGKEKSAVCNAVARGIAALEDARVRERAAYEIGRQLVEVLGAGFDEARLELAVDVVRMT